MIGDNPAARLLALLEAGAEYDLQKNCRQVWYELLFVERGDDPLLMSRLGKAMALPSQIIQLIDEDFPNQKKSYKYWSERVNKAFFQQNLNGKWESFWNHVDDHTMLYLRLSADLIQTKTPTKLLDDGTVEDIRGKISQLIDELIEGDFDPEFKKFLVRTLQRIIVAIDEYRISGAVPIIESVEIAFGHAFFDSQYRDKISNTEFGKRVVSVLSSVASSVTIALGLPQLPQEFQLMLENISGSNT